MSFKKKLSEQYNEIVKEPEGYEVIEQEISIKKTHHQLFKTLKISGIVTASAMATLVVVLCGAFLLSNMRFEESGSKSIRKARFSIYDTELVKRETFEKLNDIKYTKEKENNRIDESFLNAVNSFAENSFALLNKNENLAYSPLMLYTNLDLVSLASSDDDTTNQFNTVLQIEDRDLRGNNVNYAMRNNFFVDQQLKSTVQAKNAVFVERKMGPNPTFLEEVTKRNAEAYALDFQESKDVANVLQWINQSVNEENFMNESDLKIQSDTAVLYVSSLYFDNAWKNRFEVEHTGDSYFHLPSGDEIKTKFMNHAYYGNIKTYEKYVEVTDYYNSDYSVTYYVPIELKDNIYDVLPKNFLNRTDFKNERERMISLSVPKFKITSQNELSKTVSDMGLSNIYKKGSNHLLNALNGYWDYSYLTYTKQKTVVSFNEDGTVVKSIAMSQENAGKGGHMGNAVTLNRPFVYCIKDSQGLPLVIGNVNDPR